MSDEPATLTLFDICNRRHYGEEKYVDAAAYAALKARLAEVERERDNFITAIWLLEKDRDFWKASCQASERDAAMRADSAEGNT